MSKKEEIKLNKHEKEHAVWSRRSFLQALGLSSAGVVLGGLPISAATKTPLSAALTTSDNDRVLVIIRLKGGNDGLHTVIPQYDYDTYANLRPTIKIETANSFALSDDYSMPNYMQDLNGLWNTGKMKIVHGVGYPNQNLSHFSSSDIWSSAGNSGANEQTGVFGRYYQELYPDYLLNPPVIPPAIQIGSLSNLLFNGEDTGYSFSVANPEQLESIANSGVAYDVENLPDCRYGEQLGWIRSIVNSTYTYASVIHTAYNNATNNANYNTSDISKQLAIVARLIKGNLGTKIYMVTLDGFDTHADELTTHQELMQDLTNAITSFYADLETLGLSQNVLAMTISEFGRRAAENASSGTDHGAASNMLLFGEGLEGSGFIGSHPDLSNLDATGNLQATTDFRSVYASILEDWLCIDSDIVNDTLLHDYTREDLGIICASANVNDYVNNTLFHKPVYKNEMVYLQFEVPQASHVTIEIFNVLGKSLGIVYNQRILAGKQEVNLNTNISKRVKGQHFYQLKVNGNNYSKSIVF